MTDEQFIKEIDSLSPENRSMLEEYILYLKEWYEDQAKSKTANLPLSADCFFELQKEARSAPLPT